MSRNTGNRTPRRPEYKLRPPKAGEWFAGRRNSATLGRVLLIQHIEGPADDGDTPVLVKIMRDSDAAKQKKFAGVRVGMTVRSLYSNYTIYNVGTVELVTRLLDCNEAFVRGLIHSNQIQYYEHEGVTYVPLAAVEAKLAEVRAATKPVEHTEARNGTPVPGAGGVAERAELLRLITTSITSPEFVDQLADAVAEKIFQRRFPDLVEHVVLRTLDDYTKPGSASGDNPPSTAVRDVSEIVTE